MSGATAGGVTRKPEPFWKEIALRRNWFSWKVSIAALFVCAVSAAPVYAQLNTQHIKGTVGLKAGSQPPPHVYVVAPLFYVYNTDEVKTREGNSLPIDVSLNSVVYGAGVNVVTTKKLFGGNYGYTVLFPVGANNRIQGTEIDQNPGAGLTDSVVTPLSLGWHFKRADVTASYTIFLPTGRFTAGASNNTGFGMWGQEPAIGTTVYLDEARKLHAATTASFTFSSKKEDSDTKVGTAMNLEGGVGADFLEGGLTAGLVYYTSMKLQQDRIQGFPQILIRGKNRVVALGPEVQLALAKGGKLYGFLKVNYQWEVYARTNTQGSELTMMLSWLMKPITLPTK